METIGDWADQLEGLRIRAAIRQDDIDRVKVLLDDMEALQDANLGAQDELMRKLFEARRPNHG